ncbi:MAG: MFS transporter [Planctomycetaceae bacterium]|nr:MFS transporter [Planctomycetaceae bacterium]
MERWQRTYRAVFAANLVAALGMMSFLPFFPSLLENMGVVERGPLEFWSGLCFGAAPLMAAIMGPLWGALGDRFGRKLMVLRSLLALTLFVGLMGFAETPLELLLLRLAQGAFSGFIAPSITLVSVGIRPEHQGRIAAGLQMAMALGAIAGPLLGAVLAAYLGLESVFATVAVTTAIAAGLVFVFAEEAKEPMETSLAVTGGALPHGGGTSPLAVVQSSAREIAGLLANPRMRGALLVLFATQFGLGATTPLLELYVRDLGDAPFGLASAKLTGALFSAAAVLNVLAMPWWGRHGDRGGHGRALFQASAGSAVALAVCGLAGQYGLLLLGRALQGAASAGLSPNAYGVAAEETGSSRRGAAFGSVFSAGALAMAVAAVAGGGLAAILGVRGVFFAAAGLPVLALVWVHLAGKARGAAQPTERPDSHQG